MRGIRRATVVLLSVAMSMQASSARAWDDFGHMEVAAVAFKHLKKKAKARVAQLLKLNPRYSNWIVGASESERDRVAFLRAATWADSIKADPGYKGKNGDDKDKDDPKTAPEASRNIGYKDLLRHSYWHYVDVPFTPDQTSVAQPTPPNAATEIPILRAALSSATSSDDVKSYDLVWLLHLVGDVHQPLHCVSRFDAADPTGDRGGNQVKITGDTQPPVCDDPRYCPFDPPGDLHAFYDDIAGSGYGTDPAQKAASALPAPDPKQAAIADEKVWIQEGFALAQSAVYVAPIGVGQGPFPISPEYQAAALKLGKQRIALAGVRLANLLNDSLGQ